MWKIQRRTASHLFTMRELRSFMTEVFRDHAKTVLMVLDHVKPGDRIDMVVIVQQPMCPSLHSYLIILFSLTHHCTQQDVFYRYTMDCICQIAFGLDIGTLEALLPSDQVSCLKFCSLRSLVQL